MKKFLINIELIVISFVIYYLQSNFFNWFNIAGVMPSLFTIFILFIGLFSKRTMGTIYGIVVGFMLDLLVGAKIGVNTFALGLVGFLASVFDKNFSKDSRMTVMLMVFGATIIYEVVYYFLNYIIFSTNLEILNFIRILSVEVIFNIILTIIIYPLMQRFGYYIENEYKGNKLLTRYF